MAHPPATVSTANPDATSFVSHIPAKSSHGAAKSSVMSAKPAARGRERPSITSDSAAAITPYIGTCTWVSWISRLRSTVWCSSAPSSLSVTGCCTTIVVSGGIRMAISGSAKVAATDFGVKPPYRPTIQPPNRYEIPRVASRHVTSHLMRASARRKS